MAFDIDNIAGAVLAIAERREAVRNDAEAICRTVNMEVGDLFAVLTHPNRQRVTPKDAMLTGVAAGLALARGDTPSEDALRADWVSWRELREAVLAETKQGSRHR
ncbi:MAG: hypothetical protein M0027_15025 [Candidatus Dormibacteraeota bacterium]|jgi:hypothetical protein|nr:hypothetical protein [Candidatus Dormibacteraeota bacterium]